MASAEDVRKLAALARITISEETLPALAQEFDSILAYVGQLESLDVSGKKPGAAAVHNVFREDAAPHESGAYTPALVGQFPEQQGDYLKVKRIISHD